MWFLKKPIGLKSWMLIASATLLSLTESQAQTQCEYQNKISAVNRLLTESQARSLYCPGANLALSCGNSVCERKQGENEKTCPADCLIAALKSYDLQVACEGVSKVYAPKTVEDAQEMIKDAALKKLHVRIVGSAHSVNQQYCTNGIVISSENLNRVIGFAGPEGTSQEIVDVEPGLTLGELTEWLHARGKSLGYAVMGFRGMTLGGAIATGAHGSSPRHTAVISSLVKSLTVIDSTGNLVSYNEENTDSVTMKALRANLGMFGMVVKIGLKVSPQFNLHIKVTDHPEKKLFVKDGILSEVNGCDYALINWFPDTGRFLKTCGKETTRWVEKGASNTLLRPSVPPGILPSYKVALHYAACSHFLNSLLEDVRYLMLKFQPPFKKENKMGALVHTSDVVGMSHRMMSSLFVEQHRGFFQTDWEFAVPMSQAQGALHAIAKYVEKNPLNFPLFGIFLRFTPTEDLSLLAHSGVAGQFAPGETTVFFEFPTPFPVGLPAEMASAYSRPYEDLVRLLVTRYGARPHWGKNKEWVFKLQNQLGSYGDNLKQFVLLQKQMDPNGMFTNFFSQNAGISE